MSEKSLVEKMRAVQACGGAYSFDWFTQAANEIERLQAELRETENNAEEQANIALRFLKRAQTAEHLLQEAREKILKQDHAIGNVFGCMDAWRNDPSACAAEIDKNHKDIEALVVENWKKRVQEREMQMAGLVEALNFYADGNHFNNPVISGGLVTISDSGTVAAKAISNLPASVEKYRRLIEAVETVAANDHPANITRLCNAFRAIKERT